ncbi:hypothetical protein Poli38472_013314 [Pythium oligandrum]|uniref:Ankyrin repeat protein n=1 Tax=Pythium oligandrum TaxID=41045 RepID=A0A8K1FE16_PYTOL|nr:hypothetical protein Poli38472_013314 [Pythium oligandrum]|eukprot:TMW55423.1 hypothetical protein Poli38472_013314 [Pythium oligandrum]
MDLLFKDGETTLHVAAAKGHLDIIKLLLAHDADSNATGVSGWTGLHKSSVKGHDRASRILINHCADVDARTSYCSKVSQHSKLHS